LVSPFSRVPWWAVAYGGAALRTFALSHPGSHAKSAEN